MTIALPLLTTDAAACCTPVTGGVLTAEEAERIAHTFKALGDPTRVRLLSLIAASEGGEACICDLTEPVGLSQPTVLRRPAPLAMALQLQGGLDSRRARGAPRAASWSQPTCSSACSRVLVVVYCSGTALPGNTIAVAPQAASVASWKPQTINLRLPG